MLVRNSNGRSEVIDFRETAAASAHRDMFNHNTTLATDSTLSAGVPGEILGFATAHQRHGKLPWAVLFGPSISLAREGFPVTAKMADMISRFAEKMKKSKGMCDAYLHHDGTPKRKGEYIYRPNLANTLEAIAHHGPDIFYKGPIGESLVEMIQSLQGGLDMDDLRNYKVEIREPIITSFAGFKVITTGAPTRYHRHWQFANSRSGPIVAQILKVVEGLHLKGDDNDSTTMQQIVEAFKFGYVDRMKLGDPAYVSGIDQIVKKMISSQRADEIIPRIDSERTFPPKYYFGKEDWLDENEAHGTTHLTTMDASGMVASVTSTVNLEWGCRYMDSETGIILNNELDDFSVPNTNNTFGLPPSEANYIAPGKRPLSSAAPIILERDGQLYMALGGAGGSRIITAVAELILKVVALGMNADEAIDSCRLHHQLLPDALLAEHRCDRKLLRGLSQKGHTIVIMSEGQAGTSVNLVMRNRDGGMIPISDPRKGGVAAGF